MTRLQTGNENCCHTSEPGCVRSKTTFVPRFDIQETPEELMLYGDMPGVLPEDLEICFENGELSISGRVAERHENTRQIHREYGIGDFQRSFAVHELIDADGISAELKDGVLTIRVPKAEAVKPRRIKVQA